MLPALAAFLAGIVVSLKTTGLFFILLLPVLAAVISFLLKKPAILFFLIAGILLGTSSKWADTGMDGLQERGFIVRTFRVTGFPVLREDGQYEVKCGNVRLISPEGFKLYRTQTVRAAGSVFMTETNGYRSYRIYTKEISVLGKGFSPFRSVSMLRKWVNDKILTARNKDVRTLLYAMITGNSNFLGYSVKETFRMTGITHLLAISGLNVAVIGIGIYFLLKKIAGQKAALLVSSAAVVLYVVTAGFGASILRAGIMFILYQSLKLSGREPDPLDVVLVSVFPVLAFDATLLFEIGFWLSYGAVLGILFLSSGLQKAFKPAGPAGKNISETLAVTLSANLMTLPILAFVFRSISLAAPMANLLIIPVFNILTFVLFAEFISLLTGIPFVPFLLESALAFLWSVCIAVSDWLSFLPFSYLKFSSTQSAVLIFIYCFFALITLTFPPLLFRIRYKKLLLLKIKPSGPATPLMKE